MDAQSQTDLKEYADRLEILCRAQADEITRLRGQVIALTEGTDDAHSTLRRLYLDESQPSNTRLKAAAASLNFERPRLESVPPPLELRAEPEPEPLADLVSRQRARSDKMLLEDPQFQAVRDRQVISLKPNGDGTDSGDNHS
jgi:hypothetical protein